MKNKKQENMLDTIIQYIKSMFTPPAPKRASGADRKTKDTTLFTVEEYRAIKLARNNEFPYITWGEFAKQMNTRYSVNKTKTTWTNIVNRSTAYLQKLDY